MLKLRIYFGRETGLVPGTMSVTVPNNYTIYDMKKWLQDEYHKNINQQIWIINNKITSNNERIEAFFSTNNQHINNFIIVFVFIKTFIDHSRNLIKQLPRPFLLELSNHYGGAKLGEKLNEWECPACSVLNFQKNRICTICGNEKPDEFKTPDELLPVGWDCPVCSLRNSPLRPACAACMSDRPDHFQIPAYKDLSEQDKILIDKEKAADRQYKEYEEELRREQRLQAGELREAFFSSDNLPYVPNVEEFECSACLEVIGAGEGVTLRQCTHNICRECFVREVENNQDVDVLCPCVLPDGHTICHQAILHSELRALLTQQQFTQRNQRSIRATAARLPDAVHCLTPNCPFFVCIAVGNNINEFHCDICKVVNCIACRVQHAPLTCQEYRDEQRRMGLRDENMRRDRENIANLIQQGRVMHCPGCNSLIEKNGGCFFVRCGQCKMECCWGIKGARWGPKGRGDNSGGCKCRLNGGPKCVPDCPGCSY